MPRSKLHVDKTLLNKLYFEENLSHAEVAKRLGCSAGTVRNRLNEYGFKPKTPSFARTKYKKKDFDGTKETKAYMLGFAIGDLNVYNPPYKTTETLIARCHTTKKDQVDVMYKLFAAYGGIKVSRNKRADGFHVNCYLNRSFDFLLGKDFSSWSWVGEKFSTGMAFTAGYVDAEGSYMINQGRARFAVVSYDREVLEWVDSWLNNNDINTKFGCLHKKGQKRSGKLGRLGNRWNEDLWRLNINDMNSLALFIKYTLPFSLHAGRIKAAQKCIININQGMKKI